MSGHPFEDLSQDPPALGAVLRRLGLSDVAADVLPRVEPLTGGVSSSISKIVVADRVFCLKQALPRLKVAKEWRVPVERVYAEIDWLQTAATIVPGHVPRVLGVDASHHAFVMEFLPARHLNWKGELLAGRVVRGVAAAVGDVLGRIHAGCAGRAELARRFAHDANFHAIRLEPYLVETARQHPPLADRLSALVRRTAETRLTLVHGDVSPKNILVGDRGPVLLDAECAWYGDPAFDLAFCLNHLLLKSVWIEGQRAALLDEFDHLVSAYLPHVGWEPAEQLEMRAATLLPALALARVDGKSPLEYLDEPARRRIRARASGLVERPVRRMAELRERWVESSG